MSTTKREAPYVAPFSHRLFAGGIAGVVEILIMYPTDVVYETTYLRTYVEHTG